MLDYIATDYAGAVQGSQIIDAFEYAEMQEFAATVRRSLETLEAGVELRAQADRLVAAVEAKRTPDEVSAQAHALADALLLAYPMPAAPEAIPDLRHGRQLYDSTCASCHGAAGRGDGPAAAGLEPAPVDFSDVARADQRSVLSLYEAITQGVPGTSMLSYASLSAADRWALAYYTSTLAYAGTAAESGASRWKDVALAHGLIANLRDLSRARVAALVPMLGESDARAILGYLRAHPGIVQRSQQGIALARTRLAGSLAAYQAGERQTAIQMALSAYLDGVEPVEPQLNARDSNLRIRIETAMGAYRTQLSRGGPLDQLSAEARAIDALLLRADAALSAAADNGMAAFLGSYTILVREGLEALLIVVALLAFLNKARRPEATRYVHLGWVLALLAGGITWIIANYFITISGAQRELTEGIAALFAALVLIGVGLWMHRKSIGGRWQVYLKEQMATALTRRSMGFLFVLAFISVYREVFETILFYIAMWSAGQVRALIAGMAAGVATLAIITWIMLRTSRQLPLERFFSASSILIAVLAVVLAGKGVSALQEAGWINVTLAPAPHIDWLGIFPTWQTLAAQLVVIALLVIGAARNLAQSQPGDTTTPTG
ncbi:MAG: cytochrome c/FTR1 family iron permease [Gammaproteobacteria bacterium]|nr:cytochrome c/FTR1 family iron permease [Gammaproteobacteria bacterium]